MSSFLLLFCSLGFPRSVVASSFYHPFGQPVFLLFLLPFFLEREFVTFFPPSKTHLGTCYCLMFVCYYYCCCYYCCCGCFCLSFWFGGPYFSVSSCCYISSASLFFVVSSSCDNYFVIADFSCFLNASFVVFVVILATFVSFIVLHLLLTIFLCFFW